MSARRYQGAHSPGAGKGAASAAPPPARRADRVNLWARLLYLAPLPLVFAGLGELLRGDAVQMVIEFGALAMLLFSAWLVNEGIRAEQAFAARTIARPPAIPRKLLGALVAGVAVAGVSLLATGRAPVAGVVFGITTAALHLLAFGLDPMRAKGIAGADRGTSERVLRALDEAEALVRDMTAAAATLGDRRLEARIERLADQARSVFATIEKDPRDLGRARRFLSVYLQGARDATVKFAELWARNRDTDARASYEQLLDDLEASFARQRTDLLDTARSDLDIEIEVLRERLQQEGLSAR